MPRRADRPRPPVTRGPDLTALLAVLPRTRTWLLPALERVQEQVGFLPDWALEQVSLYLRVPRSEVYSVATHYPELRLQQPGRHVVRVCTGVPCRLQGADALLEAASTRLGIPAGGTTEDGEYTLEAVGCCFACSMAPMADVDHEFRGRLSAARLDEVIPAPGPSHNGHAPAPSEDHLPGGSGRNGAAQGGPGGGADAAGDTAGPLQKLERLHEALSPLETARLVVGAGMCALSVGAADVVAALRAGLAARRLDVPVVEAGCDGACFRAVQVAVEQPHGRRSVFAQVTSDDAAALVDGLASGDFGALESRQVPDPADDPFFTSQRRVVLEQVGRLDPASLGDYLAVGGYRALAKALDGLGPEGVITEVKQAGTLGRGGAYFPTGLKWEGARTAAGEQKYVVVNAEEGEPGVFKDRHLLEGNPQQLLEGTLLAAFAVGARHGVLFVNGEARLAYARLARAVVDARRAGLLGPSVLGTDFAFDVEIRRGAGGFILGEETALLECIEGQRAMPRVRPPFPVERGLYGRPTVINNAETLSGIPTIIRNGGEWYASLGHANGKGTKVFSLSGDIARPGVVEVEIGSTLRHLVETVGGGVPTGEPSPAVLVGGPSGRFVPPDWLDEPLAPRQRFSLGSGGVTVVGPGRDLASLTRTLLAFNAAESCGKCTPCREGLPRMLALFDAGQRADLVPLAEIVSFGSLCGLGQAAPSSVESGLAIQAQAIKTRAIPTQEQRS